MKIQAKRFCTQLNTSPVTIFGKVISKQIDPLGKKVGLDYFSGKLVLVFFYLPYFNLSKLSLTHKQTLTLPTTQLKEHQSKQ